MENEPTCRICGKWDNPDGHGCALATPENERHRATLAELIRMEELLEIEHNLRVEADNQRDKLRAELEDVIKELRWQATLRPVGSANYNYWNLLAQRITDAMAEEAPK